MSKQHPSNAFMIYPFGQKLNRIFQNWMFPRFYSLFEKECTSGSSPVPHYGVVLCGSVFSFVLLLQMNALTSKALENSIGEC